MVHNNPGEPPFVTKYNDPAILKALHYTGQVPRIFLPCAITYEAFDAHLMPHGSAMRRKVEAYASQVDEIVSKAVAAGLPLYPFTDLLVVPRVLQAKYGDEMKPAEGSVPPGTLGGATLPASILQARTEEILRAQIAEIFTRFPDLGGLTTRYGETYLFEWPEYAGSSPATTAQEQARLIAVLRDEVCVKRGKRLFFRTWGFGPFHTDPVFYRQATDAVEPHPLLVFSIKHVQADFLRLQPFNPCLGIGRHAQIVEISSNQAGLYGKNAHPYYIGRGVIEGWKEFDFIHNSGPARSLRSLLARPQFAGIWTWSRGDGWRGPYIDNEMWVDLDEQVFHRFAREPWRSEEDLFAEAARAATGVSDQDLPKLRELCLLSADAVMHGQETVVMTTADWRDPGAPHPAGQSPTFRELWWCRDDGIGAIDLHAVVRAGKVQAVLAEKAQATRYWRRIEELAREIRLPDPARQTFLEVSCRYGRIKYDLFAAIWTMQILAAQADIGPAKLDRAALKAAIADYDQHWAEWEDLRSSNACCPTLSSDRAVQYVAERPFRQVLDEYRNRADE